MTEENVSGPSHRMSIGGKLSFRRRARGIEESDLPIVDGGDNPPALKDLVPADYKSVEIEVGPGKGAYLAAAVEARPDTFILGIEAAGGYAKIAAQRLKKSGRPNGFLLIDNAVQFLVDRVDPGELNRLHVYFPDPWPKRRHRNRRFFTESIPPIAHRALKSDGLLLVATDNACYAGQVARVLGDSPLFVRDEDAEAELQSMPPGNAFSPTNFERKYKIEGRIIRQFAYRRVSCATPAIAPSNATQAARSSNPNH